MTQLTTDELLYLLGQKEAENFALRRDLGQVVNELNSARERLRELESPAPVGREGEN